VEIIVPQLGGLALMQATESLTYKQTESCLAETAQWATTVMTRLSPWLPCRRLHILEVGAAQGRGVWALQQLGHAAVGLEPWGPALQVSRALAAQHAVTLTMVQGTVEWLPFVSGTFDVVLACSVLEHVQDLDESLREIARVLRPDGLLWFYSASALCPRQSEIAVFPAFGWYPGPLKRAVMRWTLRHRPAWIGHSASPAMHWWTPHSARRRLQAAGFDAIWDRWELRRLEEQSGWRRWLVDAAQHSRVVRCGLDVLIPDCAYAARKQNGSSD
jgi:SAM-dependent methyltransferase